MENTEPQACIGCFGPLRPEKTMNSLSRYGHGYICSKCGESEAFEGDFITEILKKDTVTE
ncbi:MAG: hypothetical protein Q7R56_00435 [Nanoarchaeota archaeon]|nr:hypothetical protein [Nanoarchaeota archaeon]